MAVPWVLGGRYSVAEVTMKPASMAVQHDKDLGWVGLSSSLSRGEWVSQRPVYLLVSKTGRPVQEATKGRGNHHVTG